MNSTHDITYAQFDEKYIFGEGKEPGGIQFHQLHDLTKDPWQLQNLWEETSAEEKAALQEEIARRFACTGTRTEPSDCE